MKILVGLDFSEHTDAILEHVSGLATSLQAEVCLIHVAEPEPEFVGFDVGPQNERDARAAMFHAEHKQIQAHAEKLRGGGLKATGLLVQGITDETILNEANKLSADMIVVGSHGRGAMQQLLVGSTSEGVVKRTNCPVLIIPTRS